MNNTQRNEVIRNMGGPSTYYVNDDIPSGTIALTKFSMKTSSDNNRNEEGNSHMIVVNIN